MICWAANCRRRDAASRWRVGLAALVIVTALGLLPGLVRAQVYQPFTLQVVTAPTSWLVGFCTDQTHGPADHCALWFERTRTCMVFVPEEDRHYSPVFRYWGHELHHCTSWAGGAE